MTHALGLAVAFVAAAIPITPLYDGMPPSRFQRNVTATVHFVPNVNTRKTCGLPPRGYVFEGCSEGHDVVMPNPCPMGDRESYARILCHELGHVNGWPANHGP